MYEVLLFRVSMVTILPILWNLLSLKFFVYVQIWRILKRSPFANTQKKTFFTNLDVVEVDFVSICHFDDGSFWHFRFRVGREDRRRDIVGHGSFLNNREKNKHKWKCMANPK